jgi:hypothetical protein
VICSDVRCPSGSVLGLLLFNLYTADVTRIVQSFGVNVHCYADNVQLYIHCTVDESPAAVHYLFSCIEAVSRWLSSNRLKLYLDKTQLIWLGTKQHLVVNTLPYRKPVQFITHTRHYVVKTSQPADQASNSVHDSL